MKAAGCFGLAALLVVIGSPIASGEPARVKVSVDKLILPTYGEEAPDLNPDFSAFNAADLPSYPYALHSKSSTKHSDQAWRTLNLENEYLLCRVLPDLGGHLYNCRDKISNREVFYANPVVKKGNEGLRRSSVAMGIESNFPTGHSYTSASPVDFAIREDPDGAGVVVVANIDRITGMQWQVEYILRPGSAVLEQRVTLSNRSAVRHCYEWWANAAIEYDDKNMLAIFPALIMRVDENGDLVPWPAGPDRIDLSRIANHTAGRGFFTYGSREPFMAIYKPASRTGVAHFSDNGAAGKKLWVWGPEGDEHVKTALRDHFNSYVEIQASLFRDQFQYEFLNPQEIRRFTEYWIPFRDLNGLSRANSKAAVFLQRAKTKAGKTELTVQVMTTEPAPSAKIEVTCGAAKVVEATADVGPATTFTRQIEGEPPSPCVLRVSSRSGVPLIDHIEDHYYIDDPSGVKLGKQPQQSWVGPPTEAFLTARAKYNELAGHPRFAWQDYNLALAKAPNSAELHKAAGRLAVMLGRGEEARRHESLAFSANPQDEEAAYYLGLAQMLLDQDGEAKTAFAHVKPGSPLFYAAQLQLAFIAARAGDLKTAIVFSNHAADEQSSASRAGAVQVALLRRSGEKEGAISRLNRWAAIDPTDAMLRYERLQLQGKEEGLWMHLAGDPERILNLVDDYVALGFYDTALQLLEHEYPEVPANQVEIGSPPPLRHALLLYYRAYCRSKLGSASPQDWQLAARQSTRYMFPNRVSSYQVLRAALAHNQADGVAHYLLGCLLMSSLNSDRAIAEWQQARGLAPRIEGLHRNLGKALLEVKEDATAALAVLKEGLQVDKGNSDLEAAFDKASHAANPKTEAKPAAVPAAVAVPVAIASTAAQTPITAMLQAASGSLPDALSMFTPEKFPDPQQPPEVRQAYVEVQLQRLLSLARANKCDEALESLDLVGTNVNLPFAREGFSKFVKYPHFQYYLGIVESHCGREKSARKRWSKISASKERLPSAESVFPYIAAAIIDPDGAKQNTLEALQSVQAELAKPENAIHSWLLFAEGMLMRATGQQKEGLDILKKSATISTDPLVQYLSVTELNLATQ